jgi:hypothetical protein
MFKKTLLGISLLAMLTITALAVPNQLTYSGRLLQNGALVNSTLTMTFKIYNDPTSALAGNLLWTTTNPTVVVNQGIYSVVLDQVSSNVFAGNNAWLEVIVGAETLAPRTQVNSVGYALQAAALTGLSNVVPSSGNVGIGTSVPFNVLHIQGNVSDNILRIHNESVSMNEASMRLRARDASGLLAHMDFGVKATGGLNTGYMFFNAPYTDTRMVIKTDGMVGIGTTDVRSKLSIYDPVEPRIRVQGPAGVNGSMLLQNGGAVFEISGGSGVSFNQVDIGTRMVITSTGNVGIGLTNPVGKLEVKGSIRSGIGDYSLGDVRQVVREDMVDGVNATSPVGSFIWTTKSNGANVGSGFLYQLKRNAVGYDEIEILTIKGNGNIGIGTTAPVAKLEVKGPKANTFGIGANSATGLYDNPASELRLNGDIDPITYPNRWAGLRSVNVGGTNVNNLSFVTSYADVASEKMRITAGGNLGIGTATPNAKLDVAGAIHSASGKVQRDILTWYTALHTPLNVHIKTSWLTNNEAMYRFIVEGYNYGQGAAINSDCVGYLYSNTNSIVSGSCNNYAPGFTLTQYKSTDGYLVLKLTAASSVYFTGITLSLQQLNPVPVQYPTFQVFHQDANL